LTRIKAPELQASVQTVRATENLLANFQAAANFIALSVKPIIKPSQRLVGAVQAQNANPNNNNANNKGQQNANQGRGRGGRGRGKDRGRGRGGLGRGGRGNPSNASTTTNRSNINTAYYNDSEWQSLSYEQRNQVLEARGTKRNVSTVGTVVSQGTAVAHDDGISAITGVVTVPQAQQNNNINAGGNAGSQFGRRRIGAINSGLRK
jgi:hypothetical protein